MSVSRYNTLSTSGSTCDSRHPVHRRRCHAIQLSAVAHFGKRRIHRMPLDGDIWTRVLDVLHVSRGHAPNEQLVADLARGESFDGADQVGDVVDPIAIETPTRPGWDGSFGHPNDRDSDGEPTTERNPTVPRSRAPPAVPCPRAMSGTRSPSRPRRLSGGAVSINAIDLAAMPPSPPSSRSATPSNRMSAGFSALLPALLGAGHAGERGGEVTLATRAATRYVSIGPCGDRAARSCPLSRRSPARGPAQSRPAPAGPAR